jgi:hypothetical protein
LLLDKKELRDADLLRAKMRGGEPKMLSAGGDTAQVTVRGYPKTTLGKTAYLLDS